MLNTSINVISFDSGKLEPSESCIFFFVSISLPSPTHFKALAIVFECWLFGSIATVTLLQSKYTLMSIHKLKIKNNDQFTLV